MADASLKLYIGATEYGTVANPITFTGVVAGATIEHPLNPFYLWNDKGGSIGSVPAATIQVECLELWIQNENKGVGTGLPSQTITCNLYPVVDNTDPTETIVTVDTTEWARVTSFTGQASTAQVYMFNSTTGVVTFGNGVNGAMPTAAQTRYITYMPDLLLYGNEVTDDLWLGVKSNGATSNSVTITSEQQISTDALHVTIAYPRIISVTGVWLATDTGHTGTNFYTSGSFDSLTGIITMGSTLPAANTSLLITYVTTAVDDIESAYTQIGGATAHTFTNALQGNNAKLIYFRVVVPDAATVSGGSNVNFRIRLKYRQ
ncbi:MAG: hypothetical protein WC208_10525 [Gallionella sp.]|jgi:hypothetical protein